MTPDRPDEPAPPDGEPERIPDERPRYTPLWALLSRWLLALEAWLRSHGGSRLRLGIRAFWAVVAAGGVVLLVGPVIIPPPTLDDITSSAEHVSDRWIARQFSVDYELSRDEGGALRAHVEERIDAFFPADADETGIDRVLATDYQGHALSPSGITATLDGRPIDPVASAGADRLTLALDAGERLTGDHEFMLGYDLRDLAYPTVDEASGQEVDLLDWDVFGPSWPQGLAGIQVSVSLPRDLDDRLIRSPRGGLAWTLIGAGAWLQPEEDSPPGRVVYRFENDQNMPPHASAWFTMPFEAGTFTMPPRTPLFWLQTFGPLLPLVLLALTLLLALAARAVAWSDARGRPWYVAQDEPPEGVTPRLAAQLLRAPAAVELAEALQVVRAERRRTRRRETRVAAARVANRTGRLGDRPRALSRYLSAPERREQLSRGLRRVPRGFVRDLFIAAPLALTLVQWGLVRQLSHQAKLAVVWWPVAFVVVSTAIAAVVLVIALSARPLTRQGALVVQHLRGVRVYAERTALLDRATADDRLLPYAVLLAPPRRAGERIVALVEHELGEEGIARTGWRTREFLTRSRLVIRALSVLLVVGAIVVVAIVPNPYARLPEYASYAADLPGVYWSTVESAEISAELTRTDDGRARVGVSERLAVSFDDSVAVVPQFAQQWPDLVDGQSLDVRVTDVRIDGEAVPFTTQQDADTLLMRTTMSTVLSGRHDVRVDYEVGSAAVAARTPDGVVDRVRWAALLDGWEYDHGWGQEAPDPLRVELRLPDDLVEEALRAGWITRDPDGADRARDWPQSVVPFGSVAAEIGRDEPTEETVQEQGGSRLVRLDLRQNEYGAYPFAITNDDVGASLDFPAGTFVGPDESALGRSEALAAAPFAVILAVGALAVLLGAAGVVAGARRARRVFEPGVPRDLVRWLATGATLATAVLFVWASAEMSEDEPVFPWIGGAAGLALVAWVADLVLTRRSRRPA